LGKITCLSTNIELKSFIFVAAEEKRAEFYSTIPCQVLEELIRIYRMDLVTKL
jgi:hypothetical protein